MAALAVAPGVAHWPGYLDPAEQAALVAELREAARQAPFYVPRMPKTGKPFSVRMTNCGSLGWVSDERGYRYQPLHPETGAPWPKIPARLLRAWEELAGYPHPPEACLVNFYEPSAKLGLHQDRDEQDFDAPVLSLSLGDTAVFRIGGTSRGGKTLSLKLASGDALAFGGEARLAYHGIDRILAGSSSLLPQAGRINLTMRRVTKPSAGG
ncbi:alkylated DNA repair protein (DNA oxidative demethylase) [Bosea sp. CRIB-10]|uniref:alpha-ketoglutarate-dependent dioxygenase AlkB family protein n=1 Tax=Bosea sp. CRIB-10 TaxID=378404 RepID=UPI0008EBDFF8|nr:alpha-ketoglutarate-dependent dioxygenase AlkB [Bosea sp. CRIB-10]SFB82427.1 alkylated DNA repair protein (DNA oxidative demethylase) [Bosea sp. CRIB-10]